MLSTINLIDTNYIKSHSTVQQLVDNFLFDPFIPIAQDLYIKPILGNDLYNGLISAVTANSGTSVTGLTSGLTSGYTALLNEVQLPLCYYTLYDCFPYLTYKISKIGVERRSGDNLTPLEVGELNFLRKDLLERAKSLSVLLQQFLDENQAIYNLNNSCSNKTTNLGGFYFRR